MRKRYIILIIVTLLLLGLFAKLYMFSGKTVMIDLSNYEDFSYVSVFLDEKPILTPNEQDKTYVIDEWSGSKNLTVKASAYQDYTLNKAYRSSGTEIIIPTPERREAIDIVTTLDDGYSREQYTVKTAEFLNAGWIGYKLVSAGSGLELPMVADYDKGESKWKSTTYGGEYELDVLIDNLNIPNVVLDYVFES